MIGLQTRRFNDRIENFSNTCKRKIQCLPTEIFQSLGTDTKTSLTKLTSFVEIKPPRLIRIPRPIQNTIFDINLSKSSLCVRLHQNFTQAHSQIESITTITDAKIVTTSNIDWALKLIIQTRLNALFMCLYN